MISLYELKPKFQNLLRPLVKKFASIGITANQVTMTAMILSAIVGGLISIYSEQKVWFFLVPILLFVRMALNAIDGMLAREHKMQSPLGTISNELGDVISDAVLYLPFALLAGVSGELIVGIVVLAMISEMAGVLGLVIGASRRYDGPMGKSDRAFVFGLLAILIGMEIPITPWINAVLWLIIALILLNIVQRVRKALQEVR
jgi:CDP-diacylglycerol--glycerol-3-phosphate 3-phosphatidyltransferase